jgi:flagellar hook-associated protein 3 FlgL
MRVTQNMLATNTLRNISSSYEKLGTLQNQLSSGKKITKPSDDPVVAVKGMGYRSQLAEVDQFQRNLSELHTWMDTSDAGMEQANSALQRIRELVVQGNSDTLTDSDRQSIADEVKQLKSDLVNTANTQVSGKYIFHGSDVATKPVIDGDPPTVATNPVTNYKVEVSSGVYLQANVDPAKSFNQDLFTTVNDIQNAMENDPSKLNDLLGKLDGVMNTMSSERSNLGARTNQLDMVENRLSQQSDLATQVLSDNEDAQIEQVITDLTTQESVHRAALSVGSQIIQPTLMDFLK